MSKHFTWELEAYLTHNLSETERKQVEAHLQTCPLCAEELQALQDLRQALQISLKNNLGQPNPSLNLHHRTRQRLREQAQASSNTTVWGKFGQAFNWGVTTLLLICVLGSGFFLLLRQSRGVEPNPAAMILSPSPSPALSSITPSPTPNQTSISPSQVQQSPPTSILSPTPSPTQTPKHIKPVPIVTPTLVLPTPETSTPAVALAHTPVIPEPTGKIAFSFYNPAPERQTYEIHLLDVATGQHHIFPLDDVSEPALSNNGQKLAYRSWGKADKPRSLLSGDLAGGTRHQVGGFWEDAQPDWSPHGERLLYASQRESDRQWRLYSSGAAGDQEVNLGLEGQWPSFAPNGEDFVYGGCSIEGNQCGLCRPI